MRIALGVLRDLVRETTQVGASPTYLKKERIREAIQSLITQRVGSGVIGDQDELDGFFADVEMSVKALKMVPIDVWLKVTSQKP